MSVKYDLSGGSELHFFGKIKVLRAYMVSQFMNTPGIKLCQKSELVRKSYEDIEHGVTVSNDNSILERDRAVHFGLFHIWNQLLMRVYL